MANDPQVGSPEWRRDRLDKRLNAAQGNLSLLDDYYEGRHKLAFSGTKFREAFGGLFKAFADNWTSIVVDVMVERLAVQGFRLPDAAGGSVKQITTGDAQAWDIWQANQLDADSQIAHTEAAVLGKSFALVAPPASDGEAPVITIESAKQVVTESIAGYRRQRVAAWKKWRDDSGYLFGTLYTPESIFKWRSSGAVEENALNLELASITWVERVVQGEDFGAINPLGVVPMVPICNRPRLLLDGKSEIEPIIPIQNAVNKLLADMLVGSERQALPQRWATGLELPTDPETGAVIDNLRTTISKLIVNPAPDGGFGDFATADLQNFVTAIEMLVQHIASQSRTPPHYMSMLQGQLPSGETLKSAEAGLVAKVRNRMLFFGEDWEEVIRLAFIAAGDEKKAAAAVSAEVIWGDPESRSESEHVDALMKLQSLGVPEEILWERAGFSPAEIERMQQIIAAHPPTPIIAPPAAVPTPAIPVAAA